MRIFSSWERKWSSLWINVKKAVRNGDGIKDIEHARPKVTEGEDNVKSNNGE